MSPFTRQAAFLVALYVFVAALRIWARDHLLRKEERERRGRRAQEWERRVGIPYDPDATEEGRRP